MTQDIPSRPVSLYSVSQLAGGYVERACSKGCEKTEVSTEIFVGTGGFTLLANHQAEHLPSTVICILLHEDLY